MKFLYLICVLFLFGYSEEKTVQVKQNESTPKESSKVMNISTVNEATVYTDLDVILRKVYKEIGYDVNLIKFPAKRALFEAQNNKEIDAEFGRVKEVESYLTNLIRIPVPMHQLLISAFIREGFDFKFKSWDDLKKYKCGTVRGFLAMEKKVMAVNGNLYTTAAQSIEALVDKRIDVVILSVKIGGPELKKYKGIKIAEPPIQKLGIYHFINKQHESLVPALTKAFSKVTGNDAED